jgi:hypothetical protein
LLQEATTALRQRSEKLLSIFDEMPDHLEPADFSRARNILGQLRGIKQEAHGESLKDQRPFNKAAKTVEEFYNEIELPL